MIAFGCIRRLLVLALIGLLAAAAWLYRDRIAAAWRDARGLRDQPLVASEALAETAAARIDSLAGRKLARAAFSEVELQSLLRYRFDGIMPAFVDSARVSLEGDRIRLAGRVPLDRLPAGGALDDVRAVLPDTAEITLTGTMLPLDAGRVAFGVNQVTAARVPLPKRIIPAALRRLGRTAEPGLPEDAIALRLPQGVTAAYIRNDSLVLITRAGAH
ncbi:MAG: hypothetical protein FIB01_15060 [Gemmatimonadetes bacterium]|nr:hypothetical protein [Gemmatimonadota bacterium]